MNPFDLRHYKIQIPQQSCRNCKYSCNGGYPSNPLECEHPIELRKSIEYGERIVVNPHGICDEYEFDTYEKGHVDKNDWTDWIDSYRNFIKPGEGKFYITKMSDDLIKVYEDLERGVYNYGRIKCCINGTNTG